MCVTGRSGYPNQINNVLVFFGIFHGTFDVHAGNTNEEMKAAEEGDWLALPMTIPPRTILSP